MVFGSSDQNAGHPSREKKELVPGDISGSTSQPTLREYPAT
jgi:hypothetical protein